MFQTKVVEEVKTHILGSVTFFKKSYRLWDNVDKIFRPGQATDEYMKHAHLHAGYLTPDTHSEYVTLTAFPRQQWWRECSSMLLYTYIACIVEMKSYTDSFKHLHLNLSLWSRMRRTK